MVLVLNRELERLFKAQASLNSERMKPTWTFLSMMLMPYENIIEGVHLNKPANKHTYLGKTA